MQESVSFRRAVVVCSIAWFMAPGSASPALAQTESANVAVEAIPILPPGYTYIQANHVSDVPGIAFLTDPSLVNPWGMAMLGTSPFWIANDGTSKATIYQEPPGSDTLNPLALVVTIPGGLPTGIVANGTSDFVVASQPQRFLWASITGNITAWSTASGTTASVVASLPGHVYMGLAIGSSGANNFLYAADFANGAIDVFNNTFTLQSAASFPFVDPTIPATAGNTYHPFNIQNIGGVLYVTYAKVGVDGRPENGPGNGYVSKFGTNGAFIGRLISNGVLDAPWGVAIAPVTFGILGAYLLVGNFSDAGRINAFNPTTGAFLGTLSDEGNSPVEIDQLWALTFGNGATGGDPGALYFTAGIAKEEHGLFGSLRPTVASQVTFFQFSNSDYMVNETDATISITVVRSGNTTGTSTINYAALPESQPLRATPGSDFTLAPGTLTFGPGETSRTFLVNILTDASIEGDETIKLVLSNPTNAGFTVPKTATLLIIDHGTTETPGDLQGDGKADLLWRHESSGSNSAWLMNGGSVAASGTLPTVADSNFKIVGLGDFQGDGKTDVLWRNASTGTNVIWLMDGLSVAASGVLPGVPAPWTVAGVGDFQGDGKADIIWRNTATGDNSVWFINGMTLAVSASLPSVGDTNFNVVAVGDFQGDGKSDVFWRNSSSGANVVWLMNGPAVAVSAVLTTVADPNWKIVGSGDFQADGKDDVLWRNSSTGGNSIWFMNGVSAPVTAAIPSVGDTNWKVARVADFQGDRKADIIWRNSVSGANAQWLMDGPAIVVSSSLPTVADTGWQIATTR